MKGGCKAIALGFCFGLLAFGYWIKAGFLMWEALEEKRIA
jgi:hypothetical protein